MVFVSIALIIVDAILIIWLALKVWDAIRVWRYNRKAAHRREVAQAFADGCAFVMGEYAKRPVQTYRVTLATPDRPADPWIQQAKQEAADLIQDVEESGI